MATILTIVKMSDIPEVVERLIRITQEHSREGKMFGQILNEELKKFEEEERRKLERELVCSTNIDSK